MLEHGHRDIHADYQLQDVLGQGEAGWTDWLAGWGLCGGAAGHAGAWPAAPLTRCPSLHPSPGAFGIVRRAVHTRTGLQYAVKSVLKRQLRRRVDVEDLRREVHILSLLSSHPNVAALLHTYEVRLPSKQRSRDHEQRPLNSRR